MIDIARSIDLSNILLTGATGFLGSHILYELLHQSNATIYCLVRGENIGASTNKLTETLKFYFKNDFSPLIGTRLIILNGDFSKENLGLTNDTYKTLKTTLSCVIHTGAIVKHFGLKETFDEVNVASSKRLINFCLENDLYYVFTSTIATTAPSTHIPEKGSLDCYDFTTPYTFDNFYTQSKFEVERHFIHAKEKGLRGIVFRIGGLTGRLSDGVFQKNIQENAIYSRLKAIITSQTLPGQIAHNVIELTPVDCCSHAIVKVLLHEDNTHHMLYLFNPHTLTFLALTEYLNKLALPIELLKPICLKDYRKLLSSKGMDTEAFVGFFLYLKGNVDVDYDYLLKQAHNYSLDYLNQLGFSWAPITIDYIETLISYTKKVHYLN